ncbi:N(4)-(beta-N-acetylglucosaminyl)-L-asparaginase [bacterium]|nr:N(4)-(beta-N-acetylglucosaminyl)-L-asparaginase [bacterium]
MTTRRRFLQTAGAALAALTAGRAGRAQQEPDPVGSGAGASLIDRFVDPGEHPGGGPVVVSTWRHGLAANAAAWGVLAAGGRALDAVEAGVRVTEADPEVDSVGYGGRPDRDGKVTLDACIMDETGNAGSVAFLQDIRHPVSVARAVMEKTPHVMLVGEGARRFALEQGHPAEDLLTERARRDWEKWRREAKYEPWSAASDPSRHDTISQLAIDRDGNLSGACTTSGLAYKMHGRVGDSPIIGASLYVDNEVGAACATGVGEEVMKTVGSFLIVELMRQGLSPAEACREGVARIVRRNPRWREDELQVGYLAIDRSGRVGAHAILPWFQYALQDAHGAQLVDVPGWSVEDR